MKPANPTDQDDDFDPIQASQSMLAMIEELAAKRIEAALSGACKAALYTAGFVIINNYAPSLFRSVGAISAEQLTVLNVISIAGEISGIGVVAFRLCAALKWKSDLDRIKTNW